MTIVVLHYLLTLLGERNRRRETVKHENDPSIGLSLSRKMINIILKIKYLVYTHTHTYTHTNLKLKR